MLLPEQVKAIRSEYKKGVNGCGYLTLAKKYNVAFNTIVCIVKHKTWKDIEDDNEDPDR